MSCLDTSDPRNRATVAYHQLMKNTQLTEQERKAVVNELIQLLEITAHEIDSAVIQMLPLDQIPKDELPDIRHVAKINSISNKIDSLIGPEGLAIVEIISALDKPTPKWMLEQPTTDKSKIAETIIHELHTIRDLDLPVEQRAEKAYEVFASHKKDLPAVEFAKQRIMDTLYKLSLTQQFSSKAAPTA